MPGAGGRLAVRTFHAGRQAGFARRHGVAPLRYPPLPESPPLAAAAATAAGSIRMLSITALSGKGRSAIGISMPPLRACPRQLD